MEEIKEGKEPTEHRLKRKAENNALTLIPKTEDYIRYMLNVIIKLPRTEKFNIGTEYKNIMYEMMENVVYLSKMTMEQRWDYSIKIDAQIQIQRIFLRIMKDNNWINEKKFKIAIDIIGEIGKINGGLIKYYAKNYKK